MKLKPTLAVILGFTIGIFLCVLIGWFAPFNRGTHWRDIVIETQQKLLDAQRELEVYHIDDAERRAHDMRTWGIDTLEPDLLDGQEYIDSLKPEDSIEDSLNP